MKKDSNNDEISDWYDWVHERIKSVENNSKTEERKARTVIISGSKAIGKKTLKTVCMISIYTHHSSK